MKVLAIDQGTTSTRALIVDEGRAEPLFSRRQAQSYPAPGRVEHDPEELLADLRECLSRAAARGDVAAAGLANQGESCLAWDAETGRAVTPVIVWQDDRTAADCARLRDLGLEALTRARAGVRLDPYFSASKLGWILREVPEARDLAARGRLRLGTTDAFFRDRLTGRFETDAATASRTSLMDLDRMQWDPDLCAAFGVPIAALPAIGPTSGDLGGLPGGLRLRAAIVDQQAALYGAGCRRPGDVKITFGTGAFALALTQGRVAASGLSQTLAWTGPDGRPVHALEGGVYTAAAALDWARGIGLFDDHPALDALPETPSVARGLVFAPALAGLGAPHWDRAARGAWFGLSLDTGREDMLRAVIEGVAFRAAEVLKTMAQAAPLTAPVRIDGGFSRNATLTQFLSDASGIALAVSDEPELTAIGLAAMASGDARPAAPAARSVTPRPMPRAWRERFRLARELVERYGRADAP